jgi:peptide methionine sulfoxide reductase msrA/msrB
MKNLKNLFAAVILIISFTACAQNTEEHMYYNKLTPEETRVIINKGTELPYTGEYTDNKEAGTYTCKQCDTPLYESKDKFDSHCGWPSFDDEIDGAVKRVLDADGRRTEIVCANCGGHLGHVFEGERFTPKNTRHCVNSISMNFIPAEEALKPQTEKAIFAGGCFWGVEYYMQKEPGVLETSVGYTGGHIDNPTYEQVCSGRSGHIEAIEITYDPNKTNFEKLAKLFFEIHDPTQVDRQGPDIGEQYRSEIFYFNEEQKEITEHLISILEDKGYNVVTKLSPAGKFYNAENYHQDYYLNNGKQPYCHGYTKRF